MGTLGTAGTSRTLLAVALLGVRPAAGALAEPELCYVLDAVLFLFSLILTGLYCRLRFAVRRERAAAQRKKEEPVYVDLSADHQEPYETLQMKRSCPPRVPNPRVPDPRDTPGTPP